MRTWVRPLENATGPRLVSLWLALLRVGALALAEAPATMPADDPTTASYLPRPRIRRILSGKVTIY